MTNTAQAATESPLQIKCGNCSTFQAPKYHPTVKDVKDCFHNKYFGAMVVEVPATTEITVEAPKVIDHQPKAYGRFSAKCYVKGCKTHAVKDHPFKLHCSNHGKTVKVKAKQLVGTVSDAEHHHCDSRCEFATGPLCVCSCGGINHGIGFLVKI
jgi:hypothetical protein